jgi:ubiquitin carboxyl-terminal hydrolase 8
VTKVRIGSGDRDDVQEEVFKSGRDKVPYLVFFRRKGMR